MVRFLASPPREVSAKPRLYRASSVKATPDSRASTRPEADVEATTDEHTVIDVLGRTRALCIEDAELRQGFLASHVEAKGGACIKTR